MNIMCVIIFKILMFDFHGFESICNNLWNYLESIKWHLIMHHLHMTTYFMIGCAR